MLGTAQLLMMTSSNSILSPPPFFYPSNVGIGINGVMLGRMSVRGGEERDINDDDVMIDEDVDYNKNGTQDEDEEAVDDDSRGGDDDDDPPKKHIRKKLSVKGGMRCHLANDDAVDDLVGNEDAKACMVATAVGKKKEGIENKILIGDRISKEDCKVARAIASRFDINWKELQV